MASQLDILHDRRAKLVAKMGGVSTELTGLAESDVGQEELQATREKLEAQYDELKAELAQIKKDMARAEDLQAEELALVPVTDGNQLTSEQSQATAGIRNRGLASRDAPNGGFKSHREMLLCVMSAAQTGRIDPRLARFVAPPREQAAAGSDEQSTFADPYGGFLIPKAFMPKLLVVDPEVDPIAGRTTDVPMDAAVIEIPARVDKNHTNSVSGGLRVYRRAEGDTSSSSRMEMEQVSLRAHALFGLAYATEELLSRSPISFVALLEAGFRDEFGAKLVDERLNGSGVGMYEGIMTSPCKIAQPKEAGQAADTIVYENVIKMRARCWRYGQAIWSANHDTLPQLMLMNHAVGTGGVPVWQPSAREGEPDVLLGRPIFFTEYCDTVGDEGDLVLGNWTQYLEGELTPVQGAESIHVRFINHERTFKFWCENDGRCWWRAVLTPKNGAATLSPFVTLAARE